MSVSSVRKISSAFVVDDCEGDVYLTKHVLESTKRYPYVFDAENGELALKLFLDYETGRALHPGRFPPAIIFLDINMPRMDGFEFLEQLQKIQPAHESLPSIVLMLSSSSMDADRRRAEQFSAVRDFIEKPLTEAHAIAIAERWGNAESVDG